MMINDFATFNNQFMCNRNVLCILLDEFGVKLT